MKAETPYRIDIPENPVFIAVDSETTGRDPESAEIVEAGAYVSSTRAQVSSTFKPSIPIPPEAMAVHHITDEMVKDAPQYNDQWLDWAIDQLDVVSDNVVLVAHNAAYDAPIMDPEQRFPWLCTYRLALHLLPMATSHSNQALRYSTGIEPSIPSNLYPHRALYDAIVTGTLFEEVLLPEYRKHSDDTELRNISRFATSPVRLRGSIRFGKHRGTPWDEVPSGYLKWIIKQGGGFDADIAYTANLIAAERRGKA